MIGIHVYSAVSPEMDAATMASLVSSIRERGQLVPVLLWRGEVIDGRKRMVACATLGIEPRTETLDDSADGARVAIDANTLRTHYTPSQRAMFAAQIATAKRGYIRRDRKHEVDLPIGRSTSITVQQAANLLSVGFSPVHLAKHITRTAAPEVTAAVRAGHLTLHSAQHIADRVPLDDQPRVTAEVIANKKGGHNTPQATISAAAPGYPHPPRRDWAKVLENGLNAMRATMGAVSDAVDVARLTDDQRAEAIDTARSLLTGLRHIERALNAGASHAVSA